MESQERTSGLRVCSLWNESTTNQQFHHVQTNVATFWEQGFWTFLGFWVHSPPSDKQSQEGGPPKRTPWSQPFWRPQAKGKSFRYVMSVIQLMYDFPTIEKYKTQGEVTPLTPKRHKLGRQASRGSVWGSHLRTRQMLPKGLHALLLPSDLSQIASESGSASWTAKGTV